MLRKKKIQLLFVSLLLLSVSCSDRNTSGEGENSVTTIAVTDFETDYCRLSEYVEEVSLIPLEFTDECILGEIDKVVLTEQNIFIMERETQSTRLGVYMFDRSGKFVRRIGSRGQGPDEFVSLADFSLDEGKELIYIFDGHRKTMLTFSFSGKCIEAVDMNYYALSFEYMNGLFYLYRERASFGDPFYELAIKDKKGALVEKYYPMRLDLPYIRRCIFTKREDDILFARTMSDTILTLKDGKLTPRYRIDYDKKTMSHEDRMDIRYEVRSHMQVVLEKKTIAGIKSVFEIGDRVFFTFTDVILPTMSVYNKKSGEVKTFKLFEDDLMFLSEGLPIGQYKDMLISVKEQSRLQGYLDRGYQKWMESGLMSAEKCKEMTEMIETRFPDRNSDATNPILILMKVKR